MFIFAIFTKLSLFAGDLESKKVMVLGGDGFCGWPTSLYLSDLGYEVSIVDNLSRRKIEEEIGAYSLTPISSIEDRIQAWHEVKNKKISFKNIDIAQDYEQLLVYIKEFKPDVIIHFAEQRAAPYSMKSTSHRRYTVDNNLNGTNNVLCAIVDSKLDIHLVHLGTMGVYGYGKNDEIIPEGYLKIFTKDGSPREILHPSDPGSVYHMTKCQDALLFYYYNKNDKLKITDLHQGIVWGTNTEQTLLDERLINRFDYDSDYGTVLNRFIVEAALGHPLTVYGIGGQTRAFINIQNTVECIHLAILNPPAKGERVKIYNQMTETHRIKDLALQVQGLTGAEINFLENPRVEALENNLTVSNQSFLDLNLTPIKLSDQLIQEVENIVLKYQNRIDPTYFKPASFWRVEDKK
jgi:UDP-sulfoquinovose synthase